jgi:Ala-tRNA(Pro) deacylase
MPDERRPSATRDELFARLDSLGIATTTVEHPPVFTVEEARRHTAHLPGGHNKSLFLKDKRGGLWLLVCGDDRRVDLNRVGKALGTPRLSFGRPELLMEALGVEPGAVTPFALINDAGHRVQPLLDRAMLDRSPLHYHPLRNDATTAIAPDDLIRFIESCGHEPRVVDLDRLLDGGGEGAAGP